MNVARRFFQLTTFEYDPRGRQTAVISLSGLRTEFEFDERGNQTLVRSSDGTETRYEYSDLGQITKTILADGSSTETIYDAFGRQIATVDPSGRRTDYQYDSQGNLSAVLQPAVIDPSQEGSPLVRPRREYQHDASGNVTLVRDPLGRETTFTFDIFGNQLTRTLPGGATEASVFDRLSRVESTTDLNGVVTGFDYDDSVEGLGRLVGTHVFTDLASLLADEPIEQTVYDFDAFGRATQTQVTRHDGSADPDVSLHTSDYDIDGRLLADVSAEGTVAYTYDPDTGLRTSTSTFAPAVDWRTASALDITRYAYDETLRLSSVSVTRRNGVDLPSPETTRYRYDDFGRIVREDLSNGAIVDRIFDGLGRVSDLRTLAPDSTPDDLTDNPVTAEFHYDYLLSGLTAKTLEAFAGPSGDLRDPLDPSQYRDDATVIDRTFDYDSIDRLIRETIDHTNDSLDQATDYILDLVGNRVEKRTDYGNDGSVDEVVRSSFDVGDRIIESLVDGNNNGTDDQRTDYHWSASQQLGQTVTDLASGQVIEDRENVYDHLSRFAEVQIRRFDRVTGDLQSTDHVTYGYSPDGLRTGATHHADTDGDGTVDVWTADDFLFDRVNPTGYSQVIRQTTTDQLGPSVTANHFTLGESVVSQTASGEATETLVADAGGSTRIILGVDGQHVDTTIYAYDAFGNRLSAPGEILLPSSTPLLYRGQWTDAITGEQFLRARWYSPELGRFNRLDPSAPHTSLIDGNQWLYAGANPIAYFDPTGLFSIGEGVTVSAISNTLREFNVNLNLNALSAAYAAKLASDQGGDVYDAFRTALEDGLADSLITAIPVIGTLYAGTLLVEASAQLASRLGEIIDLDGSPGPLSSSATAASLSLPPGLTPLLFAGRYLKLSRFYSKIPLNATIRSFRQVVNGIESFIPIVGTSQFTSGPHAETVWKLAKVVARESGTELVAMNRALRTVLRTYADTVPIGSFFDSLNGINLSVNVDWRGAAKTLDRFRPDVVAIKGDKIVIIEVLSSGGSGQLLKSGANKEYLAYLAEIRRLGFSTGLDIELRIFSDTGSKITF